MKRALKIGIIILTLVFIVLQFFQPDRTNPEIVAADTLEAATNISVEVKAILQRSCADCHSNATAYPWYSKISPFSWFLDGHIREGRDELNFSIWNTYEERTRSHKLEEICEQVQAREMPLPSYLWIHRDAVLTEADTAILCDWANQQIQP